MGCTNATAMTPDIDGTVFVDKKLPGAEFADVTVKDWRGYDLVTNR